MPEPWKIEQDPNEEIYYRNEQTGEVMQDHPMDEVYREKFRQAKAAKMASDPSYMAAQQQQDYVMQQQKQV